MRKSVWFFAIGLMFTVTGCDFFRFVAGRPTTKDIEHKRIEIIKAEEAALQARLDSIAAVEEAARQLALKDQQDSLDAVSAVEKGSITVIEAARLRGVVKDELSEIGRYARYRVIVGSFRDRRNAVSLASRISDIGDYQPHMLTFGSGMVAVAACPVNRIQDAVRGLEELKTRSVCPDDVWILKCE